MKPAEADSGEAAIADLRQAAAQGTPYRLVLLDFIMPSMDGYAVAEELRRDEEFGGLTIMMLTSAGQHGDAARCKELGIEAYLTKPVRRCDLLDGILSVLGVRVPAHGERPVVTRHLPEEARRRLRVLVAEDNVVNQELAVRMLEKAGHSVAIAGNGKEALEALASDDFDLVLMDVQMPEMDGFEATGQIRSARSFNSPIRNPSIPIIAMTAHAMAGDEEQCLAAGMDGYVSKPMRADALHEAIESCLNARQEFEAAGPPAPGDSAIDLEEALEGVDDDMELLQDLAKLFLGDCPARMAALREAINAADGEEIRCTAHALKGAASNFGAQAVVDAASRLEEIGRGGDLGAAEASMSTIQEHMESLKLELTALTDAKQGNRDRLAALARHDGQSP